VQPTSVADVSTASPEAYRHYTEGVLIRDIDPVKALRSFKKAVELDSMFALAHLEMSRMYLGPIGISEDTAARIFAEKAWRFRSRLGIKDRMRLEAQRALIDDRVLDVLATDREMLSRWPDDKDILSSLTEHLFWWMYGEEGASVAGRGVELYPDDLALKHWHVLLLVVAGRLKEALESAGANAQRHPEDPVAYLDLGDSYLRLGQPDSAEASFRRGFPLGLPQEDALDCLARCEYSKGNLEEAARLYEKILAMSDLPAGLRISRLSSYPKYIGAAEVLAASGRFKEAIDAFEKERMNATAEPRTAMIFEHGYNRVLLRMGRYRDVLSWAQGLEHASSGIQRLASLYVATASIALGSLDGARAALANLESMDRDGYRKARHLICSVKAQIALAEGKPDEALAALSEMGRNGGYWETWTFIQWKETEARAYVMAGRLEEAVATHRGLLGVYAGHALSHYELGKIYEQMRRPAEAKKEYAKFLEMWSEADEGLPQLVDARKRLAAI
jgi:tetratricopeptide (TPR) repeat protein